jgi:serine/threonine protein kinase
MLAPGMAMQQRYRIVRTIGQGGMGAVYEATDERLGARSFRLSALTLVQCCPLPTPHYLSSVDFFARAQWSAVGETSRDRRSRNHVPHQDGLRTRRSASLPQNVYT